MAAISRVIALPSATEYNPYPPTLDQIVYSGNYLETPSIRIDFNMPTESWKNKPPFAYTSQYYREVVKRDSDGAIINDSPAFEGAGFSNSVLMPAGTLCNYKSYTISNGSTVYSPVAYFTAQTKPDCTTTINLISYSSSSVQVSWLDLSPSTKWGGAPLADRSWYVALQKEIAPGSGFNNVMYLEPGGSATSTTFGGFFSSGTYRVVLYAKTLAGISVTFASTGNFIISAPPFFPYFPYFGGPGDPL